MSSISLFMERLSKTFPVWENALTKQNVKRITIKISLFI
jgi:hypothetical protein